MKLLRKMWQVLAEDGFKIFAKKIKARLYYLYLMKIYFKGEHRAKWEHLHNKFKGQRAFLLGNGPSLNKTPLYLLKNEYTMCFNRFYIMEERLNWTPSFFLTIDNLVLTDIAKDIELISEKYKYCFFPFIHYRGEKFYKRIPKKDNIYWLKQYFGRKFSLYLPKVYPGGSVIFEGLQVLNYLGFDEIYIIGVDMSFQLHKTAKYLDKDKSTDIISQEDDDPNHFDPRYFGKNRKYHQPENHVVKNIVDNLKSLGKNMSKYDLNIINAGYDSKVDSFPKVEFESLFNFDDEEEEIMFESLLIENTKYNSRREFEEDSEFIDENRTWNNELSNFYTSEELGLNLIKQSIFTHIPIGPFKNKYYFKKRNKQELI